MFRPGIPLPGTDNDDQASPHSQQGEGQPRPMEDLRQPTAAERVRTLVESRVSASLNIPGIELDELGSGAPEACVVNTDGDVILLVPTDAPAVRASVHAHAHAQDEDGDVRAVLEIIDVAPVSVPHRVRGRAWVAGWLTAVNGRHRAGAARLFAERHPSGPPASGPESKMLRLKVAEAYVDDLWGESRVETEEFGAASADPLAPYEVELLQHLATAHGDQVERLYSLLGDDACAHTAGRRAVPLALDRYGMRVRFCDAHNGFDVRFEFPEPVHDVRELRRETHRLFDAAR